MSEYYCAITISSIQDYIFKTNKLKEIIGGSLIIDKVCSSEYLKEHIKDYNEDNLLLNAAGKVKYKFESKEKCQSFLSSYIRDVNQTAPGLKINYAIAKNENKNQLDQLILIQKNKPNYSIDHQWMVFQKSRRTGLPVVKKIKDEYLDKIQTAKLEAYGDSKSSPLFKEILKNLTLKESNLIEKFEDFTESNDNWMAIIHADGNGIGNLIDDYNAFLKQENPNDENTILKEQKEFSKNLQKIMAAALSTAIDKLKIKEEATIPIRPIILGGDDLTIVMEAKYAVQFTRDYLASFEEKSREHLSNSFDGFARGITSCAGICFLKKKFPIHYGNKLANVLCKEAKRVSKQLQKDKKIPSSLLFHVNQSSFISESYEQLIESDYKIGSAYRLDGGPYFLESSNHNEFRTINDLLEKSELLSKDETPTSSIRNWLNELYDNPNKAEILKKRILNIINKNKAEINDILTPSKRDSYNHLFLNDILLLVDMTK